MELRVADICTGTVVGKPHLNNRLQLIEHDSKGSFHEPGAFYIEMNVK